MATTTNEYAAAWEFLSTHELKDVDSTIAAKVNEVKQLQANGKYQAAANLIEDYKLQEYVMCADYINAIDEKTRNLEIEVQTAGQCIFISSTEPTTTMAGDVWIS